MSNLSLAIGTFVGAAVAAVAAIVMAGKEDRKLKRTLVILAFIGLVASGVCAYFQYQSANDADTKQADMSHQLKTTQEELDKTKEVLDAASVNVDDLAMLNKLSSGKFYIQLSSDSDACKPCNRARGIDHQFPGALANQEIRVINIGRGNQPYYLIFGKKLSLAAAGVFQQLAIDHNLSNGRPLIESETGNEVVMDCARVCPSLEKR